MSGAELRVTSPSAPGADNASVFRDLLGLEEDR
jgi:hypothetical protein